MDAVDVLLGINVFDNRNFVEYPYFKFDFHSEGDTWKLMVRK